MRTEQSLISSVNVFLSRIKGLVTPRNYVFTIEQLRNDPDIWRNWCSHPGIYYFVQNGEVKYIGRAFPSVSLASRVNNQIHSFGNPEWDKVIRDDTAKVGILTFPADDWFWVAALEVFLIEKLQKPQFNKRFA